MIGGAFRLAWLRTIREPVGTGLAILGVTAIGALLFDMLLLSHGLLISFRDRLDASGFDVRVTADDGPIFSGTRLGHASALAAAIGRLPAIDGVQIVETGTADRLPGDDTAPRISLFGIDPSRPAVWTLLDGRTLTGRDAADAIINARMARMWGLAPGSTITVRGRCGGSDVQPLPVALRVAGVAEFPNDASTALTAAVPLTALASICGDTSRDRADMLLVHARPGGGGPDAAAAAIRAIDPSLHVVTNAQLVERFSRVEFSYFRQISSVLTVVTLFFGLLLIAVLLTVSVNQRLGEIAGLRAIGLSRARVVLGVFFESVLLVGGGGIAAVPVGAVVSRWLDHILRSLPGIPADARFFVFEPRALYLHAALMATATILAALYPMRLVATLPIAATLRQEVTS